MVVCPCRYDEGIALCESLLDACPESCVLRDALAELHMRKGNPDQAVSMWLHALAECPDNAMVFYHSCKFLMAQVSYLFLGPWKLDVVVFVMFTPRSMFLQGKSSAIIPLFRGFILSLCEDEQSQKTPVDVLRYVLLHSSKCTDILGGASDISRLKHTVRSEEGG